jgi:hypothetical protein
VSDKHYGNVVVLCGFDGTHGATSFTDESAAGRTATFNGNAQLDTSQAKWGSASLLCDGNGDFVSFADHADFTLGSSDFCIEAWIRGASLSNQFNPIAGHWNPTGNQRAWLLYYNSTLGGIQFFYSTNGGTPTVNTFGAVTLQTGVWYHVAASREGANLRLFVNGIQRNTTHNIGTSSIHDSNTTLKIGAGSTSEFWNGWIDEFRMTVGVPRVTQNFTPPRGPFSRGKRLGVFGQYSQPVIARPY